MRSLSSSVTSRVQHDLITGPAFIVIKAADEFKDKTTAIDQPWRTDFTAKMMRDNLY
jgi:hypothetical protein